MNSLILSSM